MISIIVLCLSHSCNCLSHVTHVVCLTHIIFFWEVCDTILEGGGQWHVRVQILSLFCDKKKVTKKRGWPAGQILFYRLKISTYPAKKVDYAGSTHFAISICLTVRNVKCKTKINGLISPSISLRNTCMIMQFLIYGFNLYTLLV